MLDIITLKNLPDLTYKDIEGKYICYKCPKEEVCVIGYVCNLHLDLEHFRPLKLPTFPNPTISDIKIHNDSFILVLHELMYKNLKYDHFNHRKLCDILKKNVENLGIKHKEIIIKDSKILTL
ncbi:MAG: hypothetical protein IJV31_06445 [Clostridia bacterium]|nr:hypothetical protein [Clostridia bacterium]